MSNIQSILAGSGLFFIFILLSGLWLYRTGRPYRSSILTVHKLISLGALVFLFINARQRVRTAAAQPLDLAAYWLVGLFFLIAIISGGVQSAFKSPPVIGLILHRLAASLAVLSTVWALYLLIM